MLAALLLWATLGAAADEAPAEPAPPTGEAPAEPAPPADEEPSATWGGIAIPLITFNSTDGLALGVGGELFQDAPRGGYARKLTLQGLIAIDGGYHSHLVSYETRTGGHDVLAQVGFRMWSGLLYAGEGGADVLADRGEAEGGNFAASPYGFANVSYPLPTGALFAQAFLRWATVDPAPDSLLAAEAPLGYQGGLYTDVTLGWRYEDVDRWPLPNIGVQSDLDVRLGGSWLLPGSPGLHPMIMPYGEIKGWWPLWANRVVLFGRGMAAHDLGERPFWEEEFIGGHRRIELGYQKAFTGYGRNRTRGDGATAFLVGVRPRLFETRHPFWHVAGYLSLFAENGWLFAEGDPGPPMPTLGVGGAFLWQGGTLLRPFVAWGWRADTPEGARAPVPQFGLALEDSL